MVTPDTKTNRVFTFRERWDRVMADKPLKGERKMDFKEGLYQSAKEGIGPFDEDKVQGMLAVLVETIDSFICDSAKDLGQGASDTTRLFEAVGQSITDIGLARMCTDNWDSKKLPSQEDLTIAHMAAEIVNKHGGLFGKEEE